jgi:hypothetical protein
MAGRQCRADRVLRRRDLHYHALTLKIKPSAHAEGTTKGGNIMKKIIKGKIYDTETAKQLSYEGDTDHGSHREWENALYQKRTGEFFAYAWTMSGGETIQPITVDEARAWLEEHGTADQYIAVFGDPGEGDAADCDEVVTLGIRVSVAAANKVKRAAAAEGTTQQAILERWIQNA